MTRAASPMRGSWQGAALVFGAARMTGGFLNFLATIVLTRSLGPEVYGLAAGMLASAALLNAVMFHWLRQIIVVKSRKLLQQTVSHLRGAVFAVYLILLLAVALAVYLVAWLSLGHISFAPEMITFFIVSVALYELSAELARINMHRGGYLVLAVGAPGCYLLLSVILTTHIITPIVPLAALSAGYLLSVAAAFAWTRKTFARPSPVSGKAIRRVLAYGLPMAIAVGISFGGDLITKILAPFVLSPLEAGSYAAVFDVTNQPVKMFGLVVTLVLLPLYYRAYDEERREKLGFLFKALAVPLFFGIALIPLVGKHVYPFLLGEKYAATDFSFAWIIALSSVSTVLKMYIVDPHFLRTGKVLFLARYSIAALITLALFSFIGGYMGGIHAFVLSAALVQFFSATVAYLLIPRYERAGTSPFFVGISLVAVAFLGDYLTIPVVAFAAICVLAIAYFVVPAKSDGKTNG